MPEFERLIADARPDWPDPLDGAEDRILGGLGLAEPPRGPGAWLRRAPRSRRLRLLAVAALLAGSGAAIAVALTGGRPVAGALHASLDFGPPQAVGPASPYLGGASLAVDAAGTVIAAWSYAGRVFSATRARGGGWSAPERLSDPAVRALRPQVAAGPSGRAVIVWRERSPGLVVRRAFTLPGGASAGTLETRVDERWRVIARVRERGAWGVPDAVSPPTGAMREVCAAGRHVPQRGRAHLVHARRSRVDRRSGGGWVLDDADADLPPGRLSRRRPPRHRARVRTGSRHLEPPPRRPRRRPQLAGLGRHPRPRRGLGRAGCRRTRRRQAVLAGAIDGRGRAAVAWYSNGAWAVTRAASGDWSAAEPLPVPGRTLPIGQAAVGVDGAGRAVVGVPGRGGSSVLGRSGAGEWRPVLQTRSAFGVGIAADPAGDLVVVAPDLRSRCHDGAQLAAGAARARDEAVGRRTRRAPRDRCRRHHRDRPRRARGRPASARRAGGAGDGAPMTIRRVGAAALAIALAGVLAACGGTDGAGWSAPERVPIPVAAAASATASVDAGGGVHVAWPEKRAGRWSLRAIDRPADGAWSAPETVAAGGPFRVSPYAVAANERGDAAALWADRGGRRSILLVSVRPAGGAWGPEQAVSRVSGEPHVRPDRDRRARRGHRDRARPGRSGALGGPQVPGWRLVGARPPHPRGRGRRRARAGRRPRRPRRGRRAAQTSGTSRRPSGRPPRTPPADGPRARWCPAPRARASRPSRSPRPGSSPAGRSSAAGTAGGASWSPGDRAWGGRGRFRSIPRASTTSGGSKSSRTETVRSPPGRAGTARRRTVGRRPGPADRAGWARGRRDGEPGHLPAAPVRPVRRDLPRAVDQPPAHPRCRADPPLERARRRDPGGRPTAGRGAARRRRRLAGRAARRRGGSGAARGRRQRPRSGTRPRRTARRPASRW